MERVDKIYKNTEYRRLIDKINLYEKDRIYCRHGFEHAMDTARIAYIISLEENSGIAKDIIYASALLHDIGRMAQYECGACHVLESVRLAEKILHDCGYTQEEINLIKEAIGSHGGDDAGGLTGILQRADKLSRMCIDCKSIDTCKWKREELNMCITY